MTNPFFETWDTPFGIPPFERITAVHIREAFDRGFREQDREIAAVADSVDPPTFANTIEPMERAGALLEKAELVFHNLVSADATPELLALQADFAPREAAHRSRILNNQALFARINAIDADSERLDAEQRRLLAEIREQFIRAGAALAGDARARVQALDEEIAGLQATFAQNVLADSNTFELVIEDERELAGLPPHVRAMGASAAKERGRSGHVFTISRSSITPFLQFADDRALREKIYRAYVRCGDNGNAYDNRNIAERIAALRSERAQALGYATHADFMLADRMAKTPASVKELLDRIWEPTSRRLDDEMEALQNEIAAEGGNFELAAWDWWYYTEKLRQSRYRLADAEVKPYFELGRVRQGVFEVARRLYGLQFEPLTSFPRYHPDIEAFEVTEKGGEHVGVFITDYFARPSKRAGAWMNVFRAQSSQDGEVRPIVVNCCNFVRSSPCLLSMDEVRTLFHEFGHGLHGLLSRVRYRSQAGTNVKQDFVELPSQIMEHWATEPAVLREYAHHFETGEPIPDDMIERLREAATFNQGFATGEYLAASYLDLEWHSRTGTARVEDVEATALADMAYPAILDPRYRSTYFQHIFSGDHYSAGYYSYIWAEVLDADGYDQFRRNGIFDAETARSFRENILERGGTEDPMVLYRAFRGGDPDVTPLLRNRGLSDAAGS